MLEGNKRILSIVVPTKDRYKYLKYLVQLVQELNSDEVELVIQDNSDDNADFVEFLRKLNCDLIRYNYIKGQIPMAINADNAILNSTGEFVCFLGDDDGFTRCILDCAKWMRRHGIEAVKSAEVFYNWPDVQKGTEGKIGAVVGYHTFSGKVYYPDAYKELLKVLRSGIPNRGKMPLVYHSIVSRALLDRVYDKAGSYFPGNSPDISNAVALSLMVKKFAIIDIPIAFSGCSLFHGGGVHATGQKKQPEISDVPWFRPGAEKNWDIKVPRVAAGSLIWADSAISAFKQMGRGDLYNEVNFNLMYSNFVYANPDLFERVLEVCTNIVSFYFSYYRFRFRKNLSALVRRMGWALGLAQKTRYKENIVDIIDASAYLNHEASRFSQLFLN